MMDWDRALVLPVALNPVILTLQYVCEMTGTQLIPPENFDES